MADDQDQGAALYIEGEQVTMADLSFREQRRMREYIRGLAPDNDPDKASEADIVPALIAVWKARTDPAFTIDDALDWKPTDLDAPPTPADAKKRAA